MRDRALDAPESPAAAAAKSNDDAWGGSIGMPLTGSQRARGEDEGSGARERVRRGRGGGVRGGVREEGGRGRRRPSLSRTWGGGGGG